MQAVNSFDSDLYKEFLVLAFDHLAADHTEDITTSLQALARAHKLRPTQFENHFVAFLLFLQGATRYALTLEQLRDDLLGLGLSKEKIVLVAKLWHKRAEDLCDIATDQTLRVNELVDMEWSFGVAASNDEVKQLGSAFLRVKLVLDNGGKPETVFMEMSLPQFYEFIHGMERARASFSSAAPGVSAGSNG
eukprot:CAMPEP_0119119038 /NCGR_PEP_ID=MMETSP1310-20130426/706_1 /TAXON_ID=464262 /ORGANISM="Genus nov. species nov., Strain RCC2339" /LENGTH=190 /DNA_ID=CAMNT_0007108449 /DNA_START=271 /DNA_END=839 /DNA_ORIENTATION=+